MKFKSFIQFIKEVYWRSNYEIILPLDDDFYAVSNDDKWGVVDDSGNIKIPVIYDNIKHIEKNKFKGRKNHQDYLLELPN